MGLENGALKYFRYGQSSAPPEAVLVTTLTHAHFFVLITAFIHLINLLYVHLPVQPVLKLNEPYFFFFFKS